MAGICLFITFTDGSRYDVEVGCSATVGDVIDALKEVVPEGKAVAGHLNWQGEKLMDREKELADLSICPDSNIEFVPLDPSHFDDPAEGDRWGVFRFDLPRFSGAPESETVFANVCAAHADKRRGGDERCFVRGPEMPSGCTGWQWRARQFLPYEINAKVAEQTPVFGSEYKIEDASSDVSMNLYTGVMTEGMDKKRSTRSGLYDCSEGDCNCKLWLAVNDVCWTNDRSQGDQRQNLGASMKEGREIIFTYTKEPQEADGVLTLKIQNKDGQLVEEKQYKDVPPDLRFFTQMDKPAAGVALTYCGPPQY